MPLLMVDVVGLIINLPTVVTPELWRQIQRQPNREILPVVSLEQMRQVFQGFAVHLVSAAMGNQRERVKEWLRDWDFFTKTGVPVQNIHFCDGPLSKRIVCNSFEHLPDIVVDDNPEALKGLYNVAQTRIFFDRGEGLEQPPGTLRVKSWDELAARLRTLRN